MSAIRLSCLASIQGPKKQPKNEHPTETAKTSSTQSTETAKNSIIQSSTAAQESSIQSTKTAARA